MLFEGALLIANSTMSSASSHARELLMWVAVRSNSVMNAFDRSALPSVWGWYAVLIFNLDPNR